MLNGHLDMRHIHRAANNELNELHMHGSQDAMLDVSP